MGSRRPSPTLVLGLVAAAGLLLGRAAVLLAIDRLAAGRSTEEALRRLADALPGEALLAAGAGLAGAALSVAAAPRGALVRGLAALASAALFSSVLTGWPLADATRYPGLESSRGRQAVTVLVGAALVGGLGAAWLAGRWRAATAPRALAPFALGLLVLTPLAAGPLLGRTSDEMTVRRVVADLLHDRDAWEVVLEHSQRPVHAGVLTPSTDWRTDGSDRPSLVMMPRAEVRVRVPEGVGPVRMPLAAGVDQRMSDTLPDGETLDLPFQVLVDGRTVLDGAVTLAHEDWRRGTAWLPVDPDGLPLRGGEVLTLRTLPPPQPAPWLRNRRLPLLAGFSGLVLERTSTRPRTEATAEQPNIVFVVMDTLRADRTSAYGYPRPTTPHLERLAARGTLFAEARSTASYTWPATGSLLTGLLPEQHGVLEGSSCHLAQGLATLAEALQGAGYTTAAYSGNPLIVPGKGFDQGFEFFDAGRSDFRKSEQFLPAALEWIEDFAEHRFFLYLQLVDPHDPMQPSDDAAARFAADVPDDFSTSALAQRTTPLLEGARVEDVVTPEERRWIGDRYDAAVATGDAWFGRVLDTLERCGLTDRTLVVFTSDHGEELFEHGHAGHGQSLHAELVRVPLVMAGPALPAGVRVATPVSNRHLAPTLALAGGARLDVPDAVDLRAAADVPERPIYFSTRNGWWRGHYRTPLYGVLDGDLVLHWAPEADDGRALYDLATDAREEEDVAGRQPAARERLSAWLEGRRAQLEAARTAPEIGAGDATREMLRKVGYLDD